jgi:hypothetical protein
MNACSLATMSAPRTLAPVESWSVSEPSHRKLTSWPPATLWRLGSVAVALAAGALYGLFSAATGEAWGDCFLGAALGIANGFVVLLPVTAFLRRIPALGGEG